MTEICCYIQDKINEYTKAMESEKKFGDTKTLYDVARLRYLSYQDIKDQMISLGIWSIKEK